ncbi:MAG: type II toxin-antitoxin system RelE/ParE family toxin [Saprospiraceae bacterium]|nr:type II toxin-antitoxin system RelE/ParE family toxin [Saprospiraceae bacterium]
MKNDFTTLIFELVKKPKTGTYLGNNCYKIRLAIKSKGKGKSGGGRVITYVYTDHQRIYLLTIYDKSETADIQTPVLQQLIEHLSFDL